MLNPRGLISWISARVPHRGSSIECGAGLGEIARFLAGHFDRSFAVDIAYKQPQIASQGVTFVRGSAEALPFDDGSADLIISMQALHHFNVQAHLTETRRVLRPGGIFAALAWGEMALPAPISSRLQPFLAAISPFWEGKRDWLISGFDGLDVPGKRLILPRAALTRSLTIMELRREMESWSATRLARASGVDLDELFPPLPHMGTCSAQWPIVGLATVF